MGDDFESILFDLLNRLDEVFEEEMKAAKKIKVLEQAYHSAANRHFSIINRTTAQTNTPLSELKKIVN